jgi:hypothetical protein
MTLLKAADSPTCDSACSSMWLTSNRCARTGTALNAARSSCRVTGTWQQAAERSITVQWYAIAPAQLDIALLYGPIVVNI